MWSAAQAAEELGMSVKRLKALSKAGAFYPPDMRDGRWVYWSIHNVLAYKHLILSQASTLAGDDPRVPLPGSPR
jgi:hypothetical protein